MGVKRASGMKVGEKRVLEIPSQLACDPTQLGLSGRCRYGKRGCPPDLDEPVVLSAQRHGITIEAATQRISKELLVIFNYAEVWGTSAKHSPQRVGLQHKLHDEDVFQIVAQTNQQQKQDKGYSQRVQNYNAEIARKRRTRTKEGKKKRSTG